MKKKYQKALNGCIDAIKTILPLHEKVGAFPFGLYCKKSVIPETLKWMDDNNIDRSKVKLIGRLK